VVRESMNSLWWQNPWAWWLLLLLLVFLWKRPPREFQARPISTLAGWNLSPTLTTGWRKLSWSHLWPWFALLLLAVVLAAGPQWSGERGERLLRWNPLDAAQTEAALREVRSARPGAPIALQADGFGLLWPLATDPSRLAAVIRSPDKLPWEPRSHYVATMLEDSARIGPMAEAALSTGVIEAALQRMPSDQGEILRWEAVVVPPAEAPRGFVVLADAERILDRRAIFSGEENSLQIVTGRVSLPEESPGPWTISWRDEDGGLDPQHARAILAAPPSQAAKVLLVAEDEPWFFLRLFESWEGWEGAWRRPAAWDPQEEAAAVLFLDPPAQDIPKDWLRQHAAWFWGFGPGGRGERQEIPLAWQKEDNHPVTEAVTLDRITVVEAHDPLPLPPPNDWVVDTLAAGPSGPWLLAGRHGAPDGEGRWLAASFRLENSDLPLQTAFPILVAQGLHWLTSPEPSTRTVQGTPARLHHTSSRVGTTLVHWLQQSLFALALLLLLRPWPQRG
jgi:hypothetical protein